MKLTYFNRQRTGKKINILEHSFSQLLNESLLDVRLKNAPNLDNELFRTIISYDPELSKLQNLNDETMASTPEHYSRWLLKMYKSGELKNTTQDKLQLLLQIFTQAKKRRNLLPNNDINSYKSIEELKTAVDNIKNNLTINQKNKDAKRNQKQLQGEKQPGLYMNGAVELLFNGQDWEVWTPHTYEGSKALRRGASWCTGGDNDHYYNDYVSDGTLYVIIDKHNPKNKLQLFLPFPRQGKPREFRDAYNEGMSFRKFVHENEELLNFFKDVEDIEYSYEDLENPDIDDEWTEEREDEIMEEYYLGWDDNGEICTFIGYDDLVKECYYTSPEDYQNCASNGYLEWVEDSSMLAELNKKIIQSEDFVDCVDWESTQLHTLYKYFLKQTKTKKDDLDFNAFLYVLFQTNGANYHDSLPYKWFESKHSSWYDKVLDAISDNLGYDLIANYVYNKLSDLGWNPRERSRRQTYYNSYSNNAYEFYLENFKSHFMYKFDDCHSVEQFWNEYTNNGEYDYQEVLERNDIYISETEGSIDHRDWDSDNYEENDYYYEDAERILDIFMTTEEFNNFDENEEDEEINESVFYDGELKADFSKYNVKIYKNPSKQILLALLQKGDVRGYYNECDDEYYFWIAKTMNHFAFESNFGETGCGFILTKTHILFNDYYLNPEKYTNDEDMIYDAHNYVDMISTDKYITKLYPNGVEIGESY